MRLAALRRVQLSIIRWNSYVLVAGQPEMPLFADSEANQVYFRSIPAWGLPRDFPWLVPGAATTSTTTTT